MTVNRVWPLAPVLVFVFFTACGGDDPEPPAPQVPKTPEVVAKICCAHAGLTAALQKCKGQVQTTVLLATKTDDPTAGLIASLSAQGAISEAQREAKEAYAKAEMCTADARAAAEGQLQKEVAGQKAALMQQAEGQKDAGRAVIGQALQKLDAAKVTAKEDPQCAALAGGPVLDPATTCRDDLRTALTVWAAVKATTGVSESDYQKYLIGMLAKQATAVDAALGPGVSQDVKNQIAGTLFREFVNGDSAPAELKAKALALAPPTLVSAVTARILGRGAAAERAPAAEATPATRFADQLVPRSAFESLRNSGRKP